MIKQYSERLKAGNLLILDISLNIVFLLHIPPVERNTYIPPLVRNLSFRAPFAFQLRTVSRPFSWCHQLLQRRRRDLQRVLPVRMATLVSTQSDLLLRVIS